MPHKNYFCLSEHSLASDIYTVFIFYFFNWDFLHKNDLIRWEGKEQIKKAREDKIDKREESEIAEEEWVCHHLMNGAKSILGSGFLWSPHCNVFNHEVVFALYIVEKEVCYRMVFLIIYNIFYRLIQKLQNHWLILKNILICLMIGKLLLQLNQQLQRPGSITWLSTAFSFIFIFFLLSN